MEINLNWLPGVHVKIDNDVGVDVRNWDFVLGDFVNVTHQCGLKEHSMGKFTILAWSFIFVRSTREVYYPWEEC